MALRGGGVKLGLLAACTARFFRKGLLLCVVLVEVCDGFGGGAARSPKMFRLVFPADDGGGGTIGCGSGGVVAGHLPGRAAADSTRLATREWSCLVGVGGSDNGSFMGRPLDKDESGLPCGRGAAEVGGLDGGRSGDGVGSVEVEGETKSAKSSSRRPKPLFALANPSKPKSEDDEEWNKLWFDNALEKLVIEEDVSTLPDTVEEVVKLDKVADVAGKIEGCGGKTVVEGEDIKSENSSSSNSDVGCCDCNETNEGSDG